MIKKSGFTVIEVMLAATLLLIFSSGMIGVVVMAYRSNDQARAQTIANQLVVEGLEATRSIRDQGWDSPFLATDCSLGCGLNSGGASWIWSGTNNILGDFTRSITVDPVQRSGGEIVESGGSNDPNTKKITSLVSWNSRPSTPVSISLTTYLTNFRTIILGDWSLPLLQFSFDLSAGNSGNANADATSVAYSNGYVYLGRASSGGREIYALDTTDPDTASLCANCQRELGDTVNDIEISGNYAYIASSNNSQELPVIDIGTPTALATATLASFDLTAGNSGNGNADAIALAVTGNSLYMIRAGGNEFIHFDISTPTSPSLIGTNADFVGTPTDMVIANGYAYVTSTDNSAELQVFNLTTLSRDAVFNIDSGNQNADAISIHSPSNNRLLVGRVSSSAPELYLFDISSPTTPSLLATLEIGSNVTAISFGIDLIFLATNNNSADFLVIDGSDLSTLPALPSYGQLDIANSPQDLIYVSSIDRVFVASSNDTTEFEILRGQ